MRKIEPLKVLRKLAIAVFRRGDDAFLDPSTDRTPGDQGETLAAKFLSEKSYRLLARNVLNSGGELDLVAVHQVRKERCIVFVEVKTWTRQRSESGPSEAVDLKKQQHITNAALVFLRSHHLLEHRVRFDVIEVILEHENGKPLIRHFENAFEAAGRFQMYR